MNNLLSDCGLVDPRIKVSGKGLPVKENKRNREKHFFSKNQIIILLQNCRDWEYSA